MERIFDVTLAVWHLDGVFRLSKLYNNYFLLMVLQAAQMLILLLTINYLHLYIVNANFMLRQC